MVEHGAYTLMLDTHYATAKPLPENRAVLYRLLRAVTTKEKAAIKVVLGQFWNLTEDGWINARATIELAKYAAQSSTNRRIARQRTVNEASNEPSNEPTTYPETRNQKPETRYQKIDGGETSRTTTPLISPRVCTPGLKHAWCDGRMHVPLSLHREFQRLSPNGFDLEDWYAATDEAWSEKPIGDDAFGFWRARWREKHGTTRPTESELRKPAPKTSEQRLAEIEEISKSKESWPANHRNRRGKDDC